MARKGRTKAVLSEDLEEVMVSGGDQRESNGLAKGQEEHECGSVL